MSCSRFCVLFIQWARLGTLSASSNKTSGRAGILAPLNADIIRGFLVEQGVDQGCRVDILSSVTSTNDYLSEREYKDPGEIVICAAEQQTRGKGRFGHQWWSPPGVNLYLSMRWPLQPGGRQYETLGLWLLIAIARLLESLGVAGIRLKWPNDICTGHGKLGGVLIERKSSPPPGCLIIGVGLDVAMSLVGGPQKESGWTDLISAHPDWKICRNELAAHVVRSLSDILIGFESDRLGDLSCAWSKYDLIRHRNVRFICRDRGMTGVVQGVDVQGRIIMRVNGEELHLHSAHVREIRL